MYFKVRKTQKEGNKVHTRNKIKIQEKKSQEGINITYKA